MNLRVSEVMDHPVELIKQALKWQGKPYVNLAQWPSPVFRCRSLEIPNGPEIWVKDDGRSSPIFGGNKVRKLELLLAEAEHTKARSLITVGGAGSNQILATELFGRERGLRSAALVFRQIATPHVVRNARTAASLGIPIFPLDGIEDFENALNAARAVLEEPVYMIPTGGSSPLGNLSYVAAAFELREQIESQTMPEPDEIVIAAGTGGSFAALAVGCSLAGLGCKVVGVQAAGDDVLNADSVQRQITGVIGLLRRSRAQIPESLSLNYELDGSQLGRAYGEPTMAGNIATERFAECCLELEPTYTAKAAASLLDKSEECVRNCLLFWNTANGVSMDEHLDPGAALHPTVARWIALMEFD